MGERPVFVGGAQRSGTHAVGHLVGSSSRYFMVPREVVFHSAKRGLVGFLAGTVPAVRLVHDLRTHWWDRPTPWDASIRRGLAKTVPSADLERAVTVFEATARSEPRAAAANLLKDLFDPLAARAGKPEWVEMTPQNMRALPMLAELFPRSRFVHVVRDGRDVACSLASLPWGPDGVDEALEFWAERVREAHEAAQTAGGGRVVTVHLEDLALHDRDRTYAALIGHLGLEDEPGMREFFNAEVTAERAHLGRWRAEVPAERQARLTARYAALLERLRASGVDSAPALRDDTVSFAPREGEPPNPLDPWSDRRAEDA
jgi:Sulfotransferase family